MDTHKTALERAFDIARSGGCISVADLIKRLKLQLSLTSIVVTHDMRLAKKLADRLVFLHEGKSIFFGTSEEMADSTEPIVQEFLELDELKIEC